ncbi:SsrA-binding protein SmpB [Isoptericola jiangsuensis]|uniref:SsrA-binding protein SmpB n=1 Tax=Isoptericola jiangsuensis TaxID=548579 RepID=UPI003AAEEE0C
MSNKAKGAKKKADDPRKVVANNKKARHDYVIEDVFEAGIVLSGTEVKALRMGRASLLEGYVAIDRDEAWLENVHIPEYFQGTWNNHAPRRKRKLLLHRDEIDRLGVKSREKGHTIVPLRLYFLDGRAKVEIALARGKKEYDKRQTLREKQDVREAQRAMRSRELLG